MDLFYVDVRATVSFSRIRESSMRLSTKGDWRHSLLRAERGEEIIKGFPLGAEDPLGNERVDGLGPNRALSEMMLEVLRHQRHHFMVRLALQDRELGL